MQDNLFGDSPTPAPPAAPPARKPRSGVSAAPTDAALQALASTMPTRLRLGTSSWTYPGWAGLVWDGDYPDAQLSKEGLVARQNAYVTISNTAEGCVPLSVRALAEGLAAGAHSK